MPSERLFKLLLPLGGVAIAVAAVIAALASEILDDSPVVDERLLIATVAAAPLWMIILTINQLRGADEFLPRWFLILTFVKVVALVSVLLLLIATAAAWLTGVSALGPITRGLIILMVTFALVSVWSLFALELHRLFHRPSHPAPRSASRSKPPQPGRLRG